MGAEVFHTLKGVLKKRGYSTSVGDEGGFAPNLKSNEEALEVVLEAITKAGYKPGDADRHRARSGGQRVLRQSQRQVCVQEVRQERADLRADGEVLGQVGGAVSDHFASKTAWPKTIGTAGRLMTEALGEKIQLVGDDIFVTNTERLAQGHREGNRQFDPDQGEPDRHPHGNSGGHADGRPRRTTPTSSRTVPAKPKTPSSPTSRWPPAPARSRPVRPAAPTASRNTTSSCASKKNWARGAKFAGRKAFHQ